MNVALPICQAVKPWGKYNLLASFMTPEYQRVDQMWIELRSEDASFGNNSLYLVASSCASSQGSVHRLGDAVCRARYAERDMMR